jgi:hypothetical protein
LNAGSLEGIAADFPYTLRDGDALKAAATEDIRANFLHALRDGDIPAGAFVFLQNALRDNKILLFSMVKFLL